MRARRALEGSFKSAVHIALPCFLLAQAFAPRIAVAQIATADPRTGELGAKIVQEKNVTADDAGANDPQRVNEAYQPKGIELGTFILFPLIDVAESYNSNIFATPTNQKGDLITHIAPEFRLRSRYQTDQLNFLGRLDQSVYASHSGDNHLDATMRADGTHSFSRETEISGVFEVNQLYEDRGSPDDRDATKPTRTRNVAFSGGLKQKFGRLTLTGDLALARHEFENVPRLNNTEQINTDRDRVELNGDIRASYELFPGYAALTQASFNDVIYDHKFDDSGFDRSSHGYRFDAGVGVDLTQVIKGDFTVGYLDQRIEDRRLSRPSGFAVRAAFNWTPSRMTVIVPSIERTLQETTLPGASQAIHTGGGILIRHELQRNIVLTLSSYVYNDKFDGNGRNDWSFDNRARAIWSLAPDYYVGGEVGYRRRNSNQDGNGFNETIFMLRFGLRV
jgi:hypothetical protein